MSETVATGVSAGTFLPRLGACERIGEQNNVIKKSFTENMLSTIIRSVTQSRTLKIKLIIHRYSTFKRLIFVHQENKLNIDKLRHFF